ncbi:MAG: helix-turn-helix transcriptional regulator [Hyphomicrobiaceae bacterium]|nr:helix-turn-helix transcriptional regulator [Hyphomicrobiaceae bacterium]
MVRKHIVGKGEAIVSPSSCEADPSVAAPTEPNICAEACPSRAILELVADKWALLILHALRRGSMRNGELMRMIGGVSQKMLTQTLRELERNGLVDRIDHQEVPPRVEYRLNELGRSLSETVRELGGWAETHISAVLAARVAFEARERGIKSASD